MASENKAKQDLSISPYYGWPVLLLGFFITALVALNVYDNAKQSDETHFQYEVDEITKRIFFRMERYESALIQTRAFFLSSTDVSREEFHRYFERTRLLERYPGIQGIGMTAKVPPNDLKAHIKKIRKEIGSYNIWPDYKREEYFSIVYLEPMDERNKQALGYDMFTDPIRHDAMVRARDSGLPIISGHITLVQENGEDPQLGFNLYIPLYKDNVPQNTVEERRKALMGFIYSPFRAKNLFHSIFSDLKMDVDIEIFDGEEPSKQNLLYDQDGDLAFNDKAALEGQHILRQVTISGRIFSLFFTPSKDFKKTATLSAPLITAITGLLMSLLVFRIVWITKREAVASQKSQSALQEAVLARDEFLSIASHELKTPLTSLKLQAQMIKRALSKDGPDFDPKEKLITLVEQTDRQTLRLERLVDDMLDISRIRTGRLRIEKTEFNLCDLVSDITERMKEQFQDIDGGFPTLALCEEAVGCWDKVRLEQVITNLLTNAIKYGKGKEIKISVNADKTNVTLSVSDQGLGISPEFKDKIFDRFERAGMSANEVSGLGLGLYITKQIVRAHHGHIWVNSEPGKGSTFIVELPRQIT